MSDRVIRVISWTNLAALGVNATRRTSAGIRNYSATVRENIGNRLQILPSVDGVTVHDTRRQNDSFDSHQTAPHTPSLHINKDVIMERGQKVCYDMRMNMSGDA